jgi:ribonuclease P protein component
LSASERRFQKKLRLNRPSEFQNVFKTNVRSADPRFLVLANVNGLEYPRLGLAVSRDKFRKAVTRNRVKRLIRESFRTNLDLLAGLDLVVVPQGRNDTADTKALRESLDLHWKKVSRCRKF